MRENLSVAFQGLWNHKLRSILTMLGIIIGIASIITIVSTIKGTSEQIKANLVGAGNNAVSVRLYQKNNPYDLTWNAPPEGVKPVSAAKSSRNGDATMPSSRLLGKSRYKKPTRKLTCIPDTATTCISPARLRAVYSVSSL